MANKCAGVGVCLLLLVGIAGAACSFVPASGGADLASTLKFQDVPGGPVAFESGQPVPTFDRQTRTQIDLDGTWRFDPAPVDTKLSLTDRKSSLNAITHELAGRADPQYDDSAWSTIAVPGSFNMPPNRTTSSAYYRRDFVLPATWSSRYAILKFGAVRYVADVWLNGHYLGYHEGGDTPFALDATAALVPAAINHLLIRVDNPEWGTRNDIVPWGLADWWNYGGVVGDVWMEGLPSLSAVRADVTPHLDGADVSIVIQHRGSETVKDGVEVRLWPAQVNATNRLDPSAGSLIPLDAQPLFDHTTDLGTVSDDSVFRVAAPFTIRNADLWSPSLPALYVLQVTVLSNDQPVDNLFTSFGLRSIRVDSTAPRLLLNGVPIAFNGVAAHEELPPPQGGPLTSPQDIATLINRALGVHADLIRVDHHPPDQLFPILADRLGLAVWEEIPLYHYTPQTFSIATDRGIAQQMLAEMDLRDFNRPSVLFHGFANESTGDSERKSTLDALRALDRHIDGTRLTGQAAYGIDPSDSTSANLDVAGYTLYTGVLYGGRLSGAAVQSFLTQVHKKFPKKPILILEFGHWADNAFGEEQQVRVFNVYYEQLSSSFDTEPNGYVGAAVWWSLDDYWTQRPGITVERFGLYRPDGSLRPVGPIVASAYALTGQSPPPPSVRSKGVAVPITASERHTRLLPYIGYGFALPALVLALVIFALSRARRHPAW
ncbi:MAG TPA: glycoside hydrolase family 2 TIM barrel-domain containing protein [Candidatus Dormibacteraeota bacterium]|nr:glycoside hydrolase family 2 TIM barrel-domain containing protein [Candidatus Dormibacteraeota bacterium]